MINLIPPAGRVRVRREYLARVAAVFSLLCAGALCAGTLLLVPTYVLLTQQLQGGAEVTEYGQNMDAEHARVSGVLAQVDAVARRLAAPTHSVNASEILAHIADDSSADISLSGLKVSQGSDGVSVVAQGRARTRESLRQFVESLKRDAFFADAHVPVSDLARDVDLAFNLTLTLRVNPKSSQ